MNNRKVLRFRRLFESPVLSLPLQLRSRLVNSAFFLRPINEEDEYAWQSLRSRNTQWLTPWNSSDPMGSAPLSFAQWVSNIHEDARSGTSVVLAMQLGEQLVGEISLGAISYGSMRSGVVGYWVDQAHAGQGLTPLALAILSDWAFTAADGPKLHRIEVALLPENANSRRVVQKLGFTFEGLKRRYMHVAGQWRDHESWTLLADDKNVSIESLLAN